MTDAAWTEWESVFGPANTKAVPLDADKLRVAEEAVAKLSPAARTLLRSGSQPRAVDPHVQAALNPMRNLIAASELPPEAVRYVVNPYLPEGELTVLDGWPGVGKSHLATWFAAEVSRGETPTRVLYLSTEESPEKVVVPRLIAMDASLERVMVIRPGRDVGGTEELGAYLGMAPDTRLVVLDNVLDWLSGNVIKTNEMRSATKALVDLARTHSLSILGVRHFNKRAAAGRSVAAGQGNIAISALARSVLVVDRHPDDISLRVVAHAKSGVGREGPSLGFTLVDSHTGGARLVWSGEVDITADELTGQIAPVRSGRAASARADDWAKWIGLIRGFLAGGERPSKECEALLAESGFAVSSEAKKTVLRERAGVACRKARESWLWYLSDK